MSEQHALPTRASVDAFLASLRKQRERLLTYASGSDDELALAIDEIGEHLLVADEELRVQTEHLDASTTRLDRLVRAYEELFASAPTGYVQTDADGLIIRANRAAARLLRIDPAEPRSRTLVGLFRPTDRGAVRRVLSGLRMQPVGKAARETGVPLEVALERPGAGPERLVLTARRSTDGDTGVPIFHWEIQEASHATPGARRAATNSGFVFQMMAEAAAELARQDQPSSILELVVAQARLAVPGCDEVGISVVRRHRVETPAATGGLATAIDQLQYGLGEGPCLHAIDDSHPVLVTDVAHDPRWTRFGPRAAEVGVGSMLAAPLIAPRGVLGALNFYAVAPNAFDTDDLLVAQAFATHAGIALAHAELEANLRIGLETREEIGRAVGILMERHRVRAAEAFDMLVVASQQTNRKIRDIAAWMNETGEDPTQLSAARRTRPQAE